MECRSIILDLLDAATEGVIVTSVGEAGMEVVEATAGVAVAAGVPQTVTVVGSHAKKCQ